MEGYGRQESAPIGTMTSHPEWVKLRECSRYGVRQCTCTVLVPNIENYSALPFPKPLFPLCYAMRSVRSSGKCGERLFERVLR